MDEYESRWAVDYKPAKAATEGSGAKTVEKKEEAQEEPVREAAVAEKEKDAVEESEAKVETKAAEVDEAEQKRLEEEAAEDARTNEFKEKFTKECQTGNVNSMLAYGRKIKDEEAA